MRLYLAALCAAGMLAGCAGNGTMSPSGSGGSGGSGESTGGSGPSGTGGAGPAGAAGNGTGGNAGSAGGGGRGGSAGSFGSAGSPAGAGGASSGGASGGGGATGAGGNAGATGAAGAAGATGGGGAGGGRGGSAGGGASGSSGGGTGGSGATGGRGGAAGGASGGAGGGSTSCATRPGLIFCDGFETATVGSMPSATPWSTSLVASTGTVTIDGTTAAPGGQRSVHIKASDTDYDTLLVLKSASILPTSSGRFYLRFNARFGSMLSTGHNSFVIADVPNQSHNFRFGEDGGFLEYTAMGDGNAAHATGLTIVPGRWTCIEILLDHVAPEIDVWIDGNEIADMHHTNYPLDNYDSVRLGFEKYAGPGMEIWYDDIAIGTQRIGCN